MAPTLDEVKDLYNKAAGLAGRKDDRATSATDLANLYITTRLSFEQELSNARKLVEIAGSLSEWDFPGVKQRAGTLKSGGEKILAYLDEFGATADTASTELTDLAGVLRALGEPVSVLSAGFDRVIDNADLIEDAIVPLPEDTDSDEVKREALERRDDDLAVIKGLLEDKIAQPFSDADQKLAKWELSAKLLDKQRDEVVGLTSTIEVFINDQLKPLFLAITKAVKAKYSDAVKFVTTSASLVTGTLGLIEAAIPPEPHVGIATEKLFAILKTAAVEAGLTAKYVTEAVVFLRTSDESALGEMEKLEPFAAVELAADALKDALHALLAPLDIVVPKWSLVEGPLETGLGLLIDAPVTVAKAKWEKRKEEKSTLQAFFAGVWEDFKAQLEPDKFIETSTSIISDAMQGDWEQLALDAPVGELLGGIAVELLALLPLPALGGLSGEQMKDALEAAKKSAATVQSKLQMTDAYKSALGKLKIEIPPFKLDDVVAWDREVWAKAAEAATEAMASPADTSEQGVNIHVMFVPKVRAPEPFAELDALVLLDGTKSDVARYATFLSFYGRGEGTLRTRWKAGTLSRVTFGDNIASGDRDALRLELVRQLEPKCPEIGRDDVWR